MKSIVLTPKNITNIRNVEFVKQTYHIKAWLRTVALLLCRFKIDWHQRPTAIVNPQDGLNPPHKLQSDQSETKKHFWNILQTGRRTGCPDFEMVRDDISDRSQLTWLMPVGKMSKIQHFSNSVKKKMVKSRIGHWVITWWKFKIARRTVGRKIDLVFDFRRWFLRWAISWSA